MPYIAHGIDEFDLQYTYEELDRMDTRAWEKIANFDPAHAPFGSVERNQIYSVH